MKAIDSQDDAKLVLDIYEYALSHDLDISNPEDVRNILKNLNQENISEEKLEQLMMALAVTDQRIRKDVDSRKTQIN